MKIIFQILGCFFLPASLFAQVSSSESPLSLSWEQNQKWLLTLKAQDRSHQWKMITDRYFLSKAITSDDAAQLYTPVLIINGLSIFITDSTSEEVKRKLSSLLTEDKIADIKILGEQPEGLYIEKAFTGIIVATVSERAASKALKKIKVH